MTYNWITMYLTIAKQKRHILYIPLLTSFGIFVFFSRQQKKGTDSQEIHSSPNRTFLALPKVNKSDTEDFLGPDYQATSNSNQPYHLSPEVKKYDMETFHLSPEVKNFNMEIDNKTAVILSQTIYPSISEVNNKYEKAGFSILNRQPILKSEQGSRSSLEVDRSKVKDDYKRRISHATSKFDLVKKDKNASTFCTESPFQSNEEIDFPTVRGRSPRIPRIIHQIFTDEYVPMMYKRHIKTFIKNNPSWKYRFWTYESGRKLIEKFHPYLVNIYNDFGNSVRKADLLRYAVIYEFGGFYFDLDTDNLRPLDRVTIKYACILPTVPFEQSVLVIHKPFHMVNGVMICRPKHPFFKQLLWNLRTAPATGYIPNTTGPAYTTSQFIKYLGISDADTMKTKTDLSSNSPYFFKGQIKEDENNAVYVPNSQYFMDKINPKFLTKAGVIKNICKVISFLPPISKCACAELKRRKRIRKNRKFTFTVHHFYFLWGKSKKYVNDLKKIHIREIVPSCIFYGG